MMKYLVCEYVVGSITILSGNAIRKTKLGGKKVNQIAFLTPEIPRRLACTAVQQVLIHENSSKKRASSLDICYDL
jgi:hypothetical protein